jgi:hypothetical protein
MKTKKIDRQTTHGPWPHQSAIDDNIIGKIENSPNWCKLSASQRSALRMISTKLSRILTGDPNHVDHWADIAGYCERVIES